jgi:hypothetical protein
VANFTPGPWQAFRNAAFSYTIRAKADIVVQEVRCEENARLIAAAPAMLAAIEAWHAYFDARYDGEPLKEFEADMLAILKVPRG